MKSIANAKNKVYLFFKVKTDKLFDIRMQT